MLCLFLFVLHLAIIPSSFAIDFLFNSFNATSDLILTGDARIESSVIQLINDSNQFSLGKAFYQSPIPMKPNSNSTTISSFSTSFVFSVLPEISSSPGFGLAFVLSNTTEPPAALSGQYFGLFSNATVPTVAPLLAVEFDTGQNPEFNDPDGNHVGIDLNNIESAKTETAGYYNSTGQLIPVDMRNGQNIHAWIEFDGSQFEINVTIAPAGMARPSRPLLTYRSPLIANYVSTNMYVGFSASKTQWVEARRVLAWSLSDTGVARDINTTNLPVFRLGTSSSSLSPGAITGITVGCVVLFILCSFGGYWFWRKHNIKKQEDDVIEDWELEYWPHRFSYEELSQATDGFSKDDLLGFGGFGRVYKGTLANNTEVAVKCVSHDSKQGLREFMAEISSMGRLQHKNLVQMRGWCRKGNELMLVYDYMPNGSLNRWIFDKPEKVMGWEGRKRVLADVAEGLNYLHHGWDQVVIHRDIKSSNILLDSEMRGRLGDFGLAKLYTHGEVPNTTRLVGTLGYLAPELATVSAPTTASDVYSFGVVILEVVCGRRPIEAWADTEEEEVVLIDWVRGKYAEGRVWEVADERIKGEYVVEEIEAVLKLGLASCHPNPLHRPTMREVVAVLVGEEAAAAAPRVLLAELSRSGSDGFGGGSNAVGVEASPPQVLMLCLFLFVLHLAIVPSSFAIDFLFNSFNATPDLILTGDARIESSVIQLINDSNRFSHGKAFYQSPIPMKPNSNSTTISSFSTSFVFSVLPEISSSPGFGIAFVLSNTTEPPAALSGQYFGLFSNATVPTVAPLLAVEFDTGQNPDYDPDGNHVGIDLNNIESAETETAGYYNSTGQLIPVDMRNGQNIHAWIEFDGSQFEINVTIAPAGMARPSRPLLTYRSPLIANYVSTNMYVGFSASKTQWVEARRVLAWSLSDTGVARDINTTNLPVFSLGTSSSSLSPGAITGITVGCVVLFILCSFGVYWFWRKHNIKKQEDDVIEDWELEYWPHRFSYEELSQATDGFPKDDLLGFGGFGRVYKGTLANNTEVAVKCVSHDSKQGLREFMAEISSMGRLQHKNLVQMRGWCRKGNELMLVYDYMPNGSLNRWIFDKPKKLMGWEGRKRVLADVAEGLNYLHHGWDQVVIHRDIKSSNILLDSEMRGRLGDFGLAKLYTHGEVPNKTRVVGTLGYLAPELATVSAPTTASDVYSFGVVILEVVCGRRPTELCADPEEEEVLLIDWVRGKYAEGRVWEVADERIKGEYVVEEIEAVLKLGLASCHPNPLHRPTMREVVAVLVGEEAAAASPRVLLAELSRSGSDGFGGGSNAVGVEASPPQVLV
ncbi:hypothetical protein F0562_024311 [Nyssa sinensis]|uniref:non-specific serine/threonine protein kinase n=1 Tax=Nyssa sinensis TaxID=561372 RepID=A0A5J5BEL7_9ASTE|nr:hypothetical protein F0562_024311 [Nyssa sinensis]